MKTLNIIKSICMAAFVAVLFSCSGGGDDPEVDPVVPDTPTNPDTPTTPDTPTEAKKTHTLLLYFMGNETGLTSDMDKNITKILTAAIENKIVNDSNHIAIFYDRGDFTRLTKIEKDASTGRTKQVTIEEYNKMESCLTPTFISNVLATVKKELPADTYGLVVSSHGGGWVPSSTYDEHIKTRFIGQDGDDWLEVPQLAEGLKDTHFDYILFDACFMASVEALYDLRSTADYIIASPTEVLGTGFPYATVLPLLFTTDHSLKGVCEAYMKAYENSSATVSLTDCSQLDALATAMKTVLTSVDEKTVSTSGIQGYEGFNPHLYFDLLQYVEALVGTSGSTYTTFKNALDKAVVFESHTSSFQSALGPNAGTISLPRSCGLSCYVYDASRPDTHTAFLQTNWAKAVRAE